MPRPSQQVDAALLASGRALYPALGSKALSVRVVAEHAGVQPGMFHYHFRSKAEFLRALLGSFYEPFYGLVAAESAQPGPPLARLRAVLLRLVRFAREHRRLIGRVWMDAVSGDSTAREFLLANAPRHAGLVLGLLQEAEQAGDVLRCAPEQRLVFVLGAVGLPVVFGGALIDAGVAPPLVSARFEQEVMSDAGLAQRIDLALRALHLPEEETRR